MCAEAIGIVPHFANFVISHKAAKGKIKSYEKRSISIDDSMCALVGSMCLRTRHF